MEFDIQKYLVENKLTRNSANRSLQEDVDDDEKEPSKAAVKGNEKQFRGLDKKKKQLEKLKAQVKAIMDQHKDSSGTIPRNRMDNYKKAVGKLPQTIKTLKAQIEKMENPHLDDEED